METRGNESPEILLIRITSMGDFGPQIPIDMMISIAVFVSRPADRKP
jgi:hypothetical protein